MTAGAVPDMISRKADEIADRLVRGESVWATTSSGRRRALLAQFQQLTGVHAAEWVEVAARIKQLAPGSPLVGEEWISGPWAALTYANALGDTLACLERGQDPLAGSRSRKTASGQLAIEALPHGWFDRVLLNGFHAEVWLRPGVSAARVGLGARTPDRTQGAALVLGAGNIFSIAPLDALYQLYAENRTVALKLNPITDPLKPVFEKIFAPFIDLGVIQILTGGVEIGGVLAHHPQISAVHMTGSEQTHDAIVWGPGQAGRDAKAAGTPKLTKPITSELGGVAPVIVVPGPWSAADLRFQARHVATQRLHNAGSNCIAAQILVLSRDWDQKYAFLAELRRALARAHGRPGWYPGAADRVRAAREAHPVTAEVVDGGPGRTLLPGLDFSDPAETAFSAEYFAPVLGEAELPGSGKSSSPPRWQRRTTGCTARSARTSSSIPTRGEPSARGSSTTSPRCATGRSRSTPGPVSAISLRTRRGERSPGTPSTTCRAASASCTTRSCSTTPSGRSSRARSDRRPGRLHPGRCGTAM